MTEQTMLDAALEYADRGWPIFPCRADKTPLTTNGVLDATTDTAQITKWWTDNPKANIGLDCGGAGLMVFDLDPGSNLDELKENVGDWRDTSLRATTPRGGTHLFYELDEGESVKASASAVAPHVDVRSFHSYVLLSPSRTDAGTYTWADKNAEPAYRSDGMARLANHARERSTDWDDWIIEQDLPENVDAAVKWLLNDAKISIEGSGGDINAYATAAMMKSFGISVSNAFDVMWEHWNPRCDPPWDPEEVDHLQSKVEHAYSYNTSPPGNITNAYRIAKQNALFETVQRVTLPSGRERMSPNGRFRFVDREGMEHIKPPTWLIPNLIPEGGYAMIYGAPWTGKTFLALDIALSIASGFSTDPIHTVSEHPGPVLYAAGEARGGIAERVRAWEDKHWDGGLVENFVLADPVPAPHNEDWDQFIAGALDLYSGYKLVVIDTVGRSMQGLNENTQEDASKFTRLVEQLQRELDCAVLAIHHSGKADKGARGSSVFFADVDVMLSVTKRGHHVTLTVEKQKDGEAADPIYIVLDKARNSVAAMPGTKPDEDDDRTEKREAATDKNVTSLHLYSRAILEVLDANRLEKWSTRGLGEAVRSKDYIMAEAETSRKKVADVYGFSTKTEPLLAARCYDELTKTWRWTDETKTT